MWDVGCQRWRTGALNWCHDVRRHLVTLRVANAPWIERSLPSGDVELGGMLDLRPLSDPKWQACGRARLRACAQGQIMELVGLAWV